MNTSYSRLITETLQHHGTEIFDAVTINDALLHMLNTRGNVKLSSGGRVFTHPIYWTTNSSFGSYAKLGTIRTPLVDDLTRAEYPIKAVAGSLVLSIMEEAMNAGNKEKLIDMGKEVKAAAQKSISKIMGEQVWKNGAETNDFDGLQHLIVASPSTASSVGGISRSTYSQWRNQTGTTVSAFNTTNNGVSSWNGLLNACTFGSEGPTAVFTTKAIYALYELSMTSNIRYIGQTELGDTAFRHLAFATLPVLFDDNCPADEAYFLDLNGIFLQLLARGNFQVTEFQKSINQLTRIALLYVFGNLTLGSARTQGFVSVTG